jgi:hypothetical protein
MSCGPGSAIAPNGKSPASRNLWFNIVSTGDGLSANKKMHGYFVQALNKITEYAANDAQRLYCSAMAHHYWHQARIFAYAGDGLMGLARVAKALRSDCRTITANHVLILLALMVSAVCPSKTYYRILVKAALLRGFWQRRQIERERATQR